MPSSSQAKLFINTIGPVIQEEARRRQFNMCSAIIAQACFESNFGLSDSAKLYKNYFNLNCGSKWNGRSVNITTQKQYDNNNLRTNLRVYESLEECVTDYFEYISKKYTDVNLMSDTEYIQCVVKHSNSLSYNYTSKLSGIIGKYKLNRFNKGCDTNGL